MSSYIPLGDHCAPAMILKKIQVRTSSFPFDWIMSNQDTCLFHNIEFFKSLVEHKCENLEEITRKFLGTMSILPNGQIVNERTQTLFPHESGKPEEIYEKYKRRFKRLYETVMNGPNTFVIVSRFINYPYLFLIDLDRFIRSIHTENKILLFTGVEVEAPNTNIQIFHIPYHPKDAYEFDYTNFRPTIENELVKLISQN